MVHEILMFSNLGQKHSSDAGLHPNSTHARIKVVLQAHPVYETLGLAVKQPAWVLIAIEVGWETQVLLRKGTTIKSGQRNLLCLTSSDTQAPNFRLAQPCHQKLQHRHAARWVLQYRKHTFYHFFFLLLHPFSVWRKKPHQTSNTFSLLPALLLLIMLLLSPSAGCNILEGTQSLFSDTSFFTNLKLREQSVNFPTLTFPGLCFSEVHVGLLFPELRKKAEDPGQSYRYHTGSQNH